MRRLENADVFNCHARKFNNKRIVVLSIEEFAKYTKPGNIILLADENMDSSVAPEIDCENLDYKTLDFELQKYNNDSSGFLNELPIDELHKYAAVYIPQSHDREGNNITLDSAIKDARKSNTPLIYIPSALTRRTSDVAFKLMSELPNMVCIALPSQVLFASSGKDYCAINREFNQFSKGYFSNLIVLPEDKRATRNNVAVRYLSYK